MSAEIQAGINTENHKTASQEIGYQEVLDFWFQELTPKQWFEKDPALDKLITERFGEIFDKLLTGDLGWRKDPLGILAEIIVLDQMSRNIHRGTAKMFSGDTKALNASKSLVASGQIAHFTKNQQNFVLMPYMHSESIQDHEVAIELREKYHLELTWELKHKEIIERFGRYPHRNALLGRVSTQEELEFLKTPDSSF